MLVGVMTPKRRKTFTSPHDVVSDKTWHFTSDAAFDTCVGMWMGGQLNG